MRNIIVIGSIAFLLALTNNTYSGLTKGAHAPRVLTGYLLSGWCHDLPFRDEDAQQRATYYQAYSDGMCMMFVSFAVELTLSEGAVAANYCLPQGMKYLTVAQDFGLHLRRNREARERDPLDALISMLETRYPCAK